MKVYLVGGAVRDKLLGYPVFERDWVVVGALEDELLKNGYLRVGKDFPVFLHPSTKEEYAYARIERKSAPGYYGFECDSSANVSLEEDLRRRDLTINAMAMDLDGNLIDPYNGLADLSHKILRHVSASFVEDPVRVLRVARFAARYKHLGFTIARETLTLMYTMVMNGELHSLVAERVWQEWQKSLETKNPEVFIETLRACGALAIILPEIDALFGIPNPRDSYLEVDTGIHTLMALQKVVSMTSLKRLRFATLVYDLGKATTCKGLWPKHERYYLSSVVLIEKLCLRLRIPNNYRKLAIMVARFYLTIHDLFKLNPEMILELLEKADVFRNPQRFEDLLVVCEADFMVNQQNKEYRQAIYWRKIAVECANIRVLPKVAQKMHGILIKEALHTQRLACILPYVQTWN